MFIELTLVGSPNEEFGRRLYLRPKDIQGFHERLKGGAVVFLPALHGLELQVRENVDEIRDRIFQTERAEKGEQLGEMLAVASAALQTQLKEAQGDGLEALMGTVWRAEEDR
jgi:hypothetical protein